MLGCRLYTQKRLKETLIIQLDFQFGGETFIHDRMVLPGRWNLGKF